MAKWIKRFIGLVMAIFVLLVIAVIALPFIIDPNDFKPEIETVAAKQGIKLNLGGEIGWTFFPAIGFTINDVSVSPTSDPEQNLASVQTLTAAVAVMPLFKKQIRVNELGIDKADIHLMVDAQGKGNWESLSQSNTNETPATTDTSASSNLDLNIARIRLSDAALTYDDKQIGEQTTVNNFNLTITDVNTEQRPFPLALELVVTHPALTKPLRVTLNSQLAVNQSLNQFAISDGVVRLPDADIEIDLATTATTDPSIQFNGKVNADIKKLPAMFAVLGIEKPVTADGNVLSHLNLTTTFNGNDQQISLPVLSLTLDDTALKGDATIKLATEKSNLNLTANIQGDKINVDRYLAPTSESTAETATATTPDSPLPLEALRGTDATLAFQFGEVIVNKMPITQLDLALSGKQGLWNLQKFNADFYQGKLATKGQFDARGQQAKATFTADLNGVAIKPLLTDVAEVEVLRGTIAAKVQADTQAATSQQLMNNLIANVSLDGDSLVLDGLNVEEKYCEMVAQIETEKSTTDQPPATWPQETTINELSGRVLLKESVINVEQLRAQVAYLLLGVKGKLDLNKQDYEISLPLTLTKNKTSENGCFVASEFLINREINVLGCDGKLETLEPAKQCGLRSGAIRDLAKQALRYNAEKKVVPKVDEKKEELEEKKDEAKEKVRDRLKDLLRK